MDLNQCGCSFYNGDMDLICNHGVERSLAALAWTGRDQFRDQRRRAWIRGDVAVGHVRRAKNLTSVVRDSGHMVPMDQPEIALDMIDSFITGKPMGGDPPAPGACAPCGTEARTRALPPLPGSGCSVETC